MRVLLTTLILASAPRLALACPVCFGQNDSPLAKGVNMGIFFMLGIVAVMLTAFAGFFIYLSRRARTFENRLAQGHPGAGDAASEGAASC
jgi:hypothetical protein